jgi:alpha-galactosidase
VQTIEFIPEFRLGTSNLDLRTLSPVIDGQTYTDIPYSVKRCNEHHTQLEYVIESTIIFTVDVRQTSADLLELSWSIAGLTYSPDDFGICFKHVENLWQYLRNGYNSWDGSYYVDPEALQGIEAVSNHGYGMVQLCPRGDGECVVLGFDQHERFQHIFHVSTEAVPPALTITTCWDRKRSDLSQTLQSEQLLIITDNDYERALRRWAEIVAQRAIRPPRIPKRAVKGWCSWYNLYAHIDEESILADLRGAAEVRDRERLPLDVFLIDDGFTPEMGDWLKVKPQFPRGMKPLLNDVRAAGFTPGLWIAPFVVGNRSKLYRQHPDWVVHDVETGKPIAQWKPYGEYRWHKQSGEYYILDVTHPDAFNYIQNIFRVWRNDWGCEYFKIDFLFYGAEYGPDRARWHTPGLTRIEVWRKMAEMIRAEIGDAFWQASGAPLWASVGMVDGMRVGSDVGVRWSGFLSAESLLRDQAARNFTNGILWQTDPDCVLLRDHEHHLSDTEVTALALYSGMSGGILLTSDSLHELSSERIRLLRLILGQQTSLSVCLNPLLGRAQLSYTLQYHTGHLFDEPGQRLVTHSADPVVVQVRDISGSRNDGCILVLNTAKHPIQRIYTFTQLGLPDTLYTCVWNKTVALSEQSPDSRINVRLAPHEATLIFVSPLPFTSIPDTIS